MSLHGFPVHLVSDGIDWPAWVQAVGSIVAIFASAGIAILVDRRAAKRLRQDRASEAAAHYSAGLGALRVARTLVGQVRSGFNDAHGDKDLFTAAPRAAEIKTGIEMLNFYRERGVLQPPLLYAVIAVTQQLTQLLLLLQKNNNGNNLTYAQLDVGLRETEGAIAEALRVLDQP